MLLTITTTHTPATDLGYLLHKHPERVHTFEFGFGRAQVYYPEVGRERTTAALLLEVDPIGLVRGRRGPGGEGRTLEHYVNDRPYVASSFLSVALSEVFGTALAGRSKERPELAGQPIALEAKLAVVPCRGGEAFLRRLFEPLGYEVEATAEPLDPARPEWGPSAFFTVTLRSERRLSELLAHLYVLIPVLDNDKHYWVGDDEVDKLIRRGEGWLEVHPEREVIARRYLKHQPSLTRRALARLEEDSPEVEELESIAPPFEEGLERPLSLNEQRLGAVLSVLRECGARRVLDLGCGEGHLLRLLLKERQVDQIVGVDVSFRALEVASEKLHLDRLSERERARIKLLHGSVTYRDERLTGFDGAAVVEVIEHLELGRLPAFERVVFEFARPTVVVVTTPNVEYNVRFPSLAAGEKRHGDHRFEWRRVDFESWAQVVGERFGYHVRFLPVGQVDAEVGAPTQMAVFTR